MKGSLITFAAMMLVACSTQAPKAVGVHPSPSPTPKVSATPKKKVSHKMIEHPVIHPAVTSEPNTPSTMPTPMVTPTQPESYPVAVPVTGKKGRVTSPYAPGAGEVDVEGYPPGAEVKDPYSGKIFTVPSN